MGDRDNPVYMDAFRGDTLDPTSDEILRVVVSGLEDPVPRQELFVRRDRFIAALDPGIPLGDVLEDAGPGRHGPGPVDAERQGNMRLTSLRVVDDHTVAAELRVDGEPAPVVATFTVDDGKPGEPATVSATPDVFEGFHGTADELRGIVSRIVAFSRSAR